MAKLILTIIVLLTLTIRPAFAQTADAGVTIISPPTAGITIGPDGEIILPPLRQLPAPPVVAQPPQPTAVPVAVRPPPLPVGLLLRPTPTPVGGVAQTPPPPTAQPLPVPPPPTVRNAPPPQAPGGLRVYTPGGRGDPNWRTVFWVEAGWAGRVWVNGTLAFERPYGTHENVQLPLNLSAPDPALGLAPGQIRVQVDCGVAGPGLRVRHLQPRDVWARAEYPISMMRCGW